MKVTGVEAATCSFVLGARHFNSENSNKSVFLSFGWLLDSAPLAA
jgi:hypothetical protein